MIRVILASLVLVIGATALDIAQNDLATTIKWDNEYDCLATRVAIHENHAFLGFRVHESGFDRIALVRMSLEGTEHKQEPFPSLAMQQRGNCSALQDVVDVFVDPKGFLWVLDSGLTAFVDNETLFTICHPKIVAFNATTGQVVKTTDLARFVGGPRESGVSRIVVHYDQEGHRVVYVSIYGDPKILINGQSSVDTTGGNSYHTVLLPDSPVRDQESLAISLNLVQKDNYSLLLINDESREKLHYLRLEEVRLYEEPPKDLLHTMESANGNVILGNDDLSSVYYREKSNRAVVYKYDALDANVPQTEAYRGNPSSLPRQVVPDHARGGVRLLVTKTLTPTENIPAPGSSLVLV